MQDIMTPIHTNMGADNRHTALIIDIRLRIGIISSETLTHGDNGSPSKNPDIKTPLVAKNE